MTVEAVSVKLNRTRKDNNGQNKPNNGEVTIKRNLPATKPDQVSFGGAENIIINFMDGIARGGFIASFLAQDFVGMVAPRVGEGLMRNSEETGQLNWDFARREMLRECLSGPSVFIIPWTMLHFIKKAGTANNVPVDYIKGLGGQFAQYTEKGGVDFTDVTKTKREFYTQVYENVLRTSTEGMPEADIISESQRFADELLEVEKSKSKGFFKNIRGKAVEGSKEDRLAKLTDEFVAIRKKYTTPGTKHWNAELAYGDDKKIVEHFKGFTGKLVDYTNDITGNVKRLAGENKSLPEILEYVQGHTRRRMGSRAITNIGMWLAVVTFYFFIPKIYNLGLNGKNPGMNGISTDEQDNVIFGKNDDKDLKKSKDKKVMKDSAEVSFGGKANLFKGVSNALDNNKLVKGISDFFEFDGASMTVNSTLALLFGFCLPTRLKNSTDKHDTREILRRDLVSFFSILFGAKTLSRMFSKMLAVTSGLALNTTPADHTNIFRKVKNYITPNGGIGILQSDEIVAKYSHIDDYKGGINDFFSYVQDNGGNVKRMLRIDKDIKANVEKIMGKTLEECENTEIIEKFKTLNRESSPQLKKIYEILSNPNNNLVRRAKTLNSSFGFLSIIVLVPAFMIWLARHCERMTKRDVMKEQFLNIAKDYMNEDFVTADNEKIRALDEKVLADVKAGKIYGFKFDEETNTIRDLQGKARQVSDIRVLIKKHIDMQMPKEKKHKIHK
ncbi:hypothetical protein J6S88_00905 [bacterium]|nr:hypothetical protein [bacterium]